MTSPPYRPGFRPGETLQVSFPCQVLAEAPNDMWDVVLLDSTMVRLPLAAVVDHAPIVGVRRMTPPEGTPKIGQLWADMHAEWYAHARPPHYDQVFLSTFDGTTKRWQDVHDGPAGPIRLVRDVPDQHSAEPAEAGDLEAGTAAPGGGGRSDG